MADRVVEFLVGRWGHPFFAEQLHAAPSGFAYRSDQPADSGASAGPRRIAGRGSRLRPAREAAEWAAIRALSFGGHVRRVRVTSGRDSELIHSAQRLLRDSALPYVVDFECVEAFTLYQRAALRRPWARGRLFGALEDERCRFVLPWSEAARRGLAAVSGSRAAALAPKVRTVLPAIRLRRDRPARRGSGPLRVLFVGTAFEAKGGVEAVRALRRARSGHDVTLDLVSDIPDRWRAEVAAAGGVRAHRWPVADRELAALFADAHVLLFPSHMDTLGFVMLEAMAHGIPVVATAHFAAPELVTDGEAGLLVEPENPLYGPDGLCRFNRTLPPPRAFRRALRRPSERYVDALAGALSRLAGEPGLHERLAHGALARVREGPLSIAARQRALEAVYRAAID